MRTGTLQSLILAVAILAAMGCDHNTLSNGSQLSSPPQPPVFYGEKGVPSERTAVLSELEFTQAVETMAAATRESIWFIHVQPGFPSDVIVYLAPQKATRRIREGRAYAVRVFGQETNPRLLGQYIQISKPGERFTSQLTLPSATDLPFFRSRASDPSSENSRISDKELVRVVDFARRSSNYENWLKQPKVRFVNKEQEVLLTDVAAKVAKGVREMPILDVTKKGDKIEITFGFRYGPLVGHGVYVTVECTSRGYRIASWGEWIS